MEFKEKFVAFIDILGFKKLVEAAEAGTGMALAELLEVLKKLGSPEERNKLVATARFGCRGVVDVRNPQKPTA